MSDTELLQRYVDDGSSDAFATLVARHLDLVYSVARRHVDASSTAKDIAQSVFIELARNARRIKPGTPIIAWLHVVSRRVALNAIRANVRRESRERISAELTAMESNETKWTGLEPFLDEAVESLNPTDRSAILLRYFENKSLREVGAALGTNEGAAQKRVTRAVEQLRTFFVRRGIPVSAVALTTDLSAHALHTAPLGLGSAISAAAAVLPTATATATQLVMATAQKILIAASLTIAIGGGIYQVAALEQQTDALQLLEMRSDVLRETLGRLGRKQEGASRSVTAAPAQGSAAELEKEIQAWMERAVQLKLLITDRPELTIPEMQFIPDNLLFHLALDAKFDSEAEIRQLFAWLRHQAHFQFAREMTAAVRSWHEAHPGVSLTDASELTPYFKTPVDAVILSRYQLVSPAKPNDGSRAATTATDLFEEKSADPVHGTRLRVDARGWSFHPINPYSPPGSSAALESFRRRNPMRFSGDITVTDLLPYFDPPLTSDEQEQLTRSRSGYSLPK